MSEQHMSDEFLANVRAVYQSSHPVFLEILREQKELKTFLTMFKVAVEMNGDENTGPFLDTLDRILAHFDKVAGIIASHDGLAMMVNAAMGEHES